METCLVDSHLHLHDSHFSGVREQVLTNAREAGVGVLLNNAVVETDWPEVIRLATRNQSVIPFLGIHPWYADRAVGGWQTRMKKQLESYEKPSGIGESGLDKTCNVRISTQVDLFEAHLETAHSLIKPITLHCVRSWGTLVDILESHARQNSLPKTMIHSFSGSYETMKRLTQIGCFISYSTIITDHRQTKIRRVFIQTPIEHLLLETDSPSRSSTLLAGDEEHATMYDEPAIMPAFYRWAARQRDCNYSDFKTQLFNNAQIYTNKTPAR